MADILAVLTPMAAAARTKACRPIRGLRRDLPHPIIVALMPRAGAVQKLVRDLLSAVNASRGCHFGGNAGEDDDNERQEQHDKVRSR
jgi:hypothetical protein